MPLSPQDVHNTEFTTVRLREGYDMQEVDAFLDRVEEELARLLAENAGLRARSDGAAPPAAAVQRPEPAPVAAPAAAPAPPAPPAAAPAPTTPPHEAAAKVLALAQRTADELVGEARAEADRLLAESLARSEQLDADTAKRSAQVEQMARERAAAFDRELQEKRASVVGELEAARGRLEREVEDLRTFEREFRGRLKAYLETQLRSLEGGLANGQSHGAVSPTAG